MSRFTLKDLAVKVINEEKRPLTAKEIWDIAKYKGYDKLGGFIGKEPWLLISRSINTEIKEDSNTKFISINAKPKKFFLKNLVSDKELIDIINKESGKVEEPKELKFSERQLHPLLTYFASTRLSVYTKTIFHEKSVKKQYSQWLHPDIVGVYFPIDEWKKEVLDLSREVGALPIKLFSFELKKELGFFNLRESFFQAVSNSSWANEGYLVAAEIAEDEEFLIELKRLTNSFGIGIIKLDVNNPDDSNVLLPARYRVDLDWDTINKLTEENPDFKEFLVRIKKDSNSDEIRKEKYDKVFELERLVDMFK